MQWDLAFQQRIDLKNHNSSAARSPAKFSKLAPPEASWCDSNNGGIVAHRRLLSFRGPLRRRKKLRRQKIMTQHDDGALRWDCRPQEQ